MITHMYVTGFGKSCVSSYAWLVHTYGFAHSLKVYNNHRNAITFRDDKPIVVLQAMKVSRLSVICMHYLYNIPYRHVFIVM